jgi:hypothetical protein
MAGKKQTPLPPAWYRPEGYRGAEKLDAGDWLLNLTLRCWLHRQPQEQTEQALRSAGPVLRRGDVSQIIRMHKADVHRWVNVFKNSEWVNFLDALDEACKRPSLPSDVWGALQTGRVKTGVESLSVNALYLFEKMLPNELRAEGVRMQSDQPAGAYSQAFIGKIDDAFEPQMLSRFVRINLSLPDDVLHTDLDEFLTTERKRLLEIGGERPYREAARLKLKNHDLRTLANVGLLQYLDLARWQSVQGLNLSFYAVREMAGIVDHSRESELRRRVDLTVQQFQLHAWFARLERSSGRARSRSR